MQFFCLTTGFQRVHNKLSGWCSRPTKAIRLSNSTIDLIDDYGNTALHYAAYHGHLPVAIGASRAGECWTTGR